MWNQATVSLTVGRVIDRVKEWVKKGLVDKQVWQDLDGLLNFDIINSPSGQQLLELGHLSKHYHFITTSLFGIFGHS